MELRIKSTDYSDGPSDFHSQTPFGSINATVGKTRKIELTSHDIDNMNESELLEARTSTQAILLKLTDRLNKAGYSFKVA